MIDSTPSLVFPGQGALKAERFAHGVLRPRVDAVLDDIVASANDSPGAAIARQLAAGLRDDAPNTPAALSLFIFACAIAHYRSMEDAGVRPGVLLGHGSGEIAALVCAGALRVDHGAEIVAQRTAVLMESESARGAMVALRTEASTAEELIARTSLDAAALAAENSPTDVVVSGTSPAIAAIRVAASRAGIATVLLKSPWALHHPRLMSAAVGELTSRVRHVPWSAPRTPVFSPVMGRYYDPRDHVPGLLAAQLAGCVRLSAAIRDLALHGNGLFVECGALTGLTQCIERARPVTSGVITAIVPPRLTSEILTAALCEAAVSPM